MGVCVPAPTMQVTMQEWQRLWREKAQNALQRIAAPVFEGLPIDFDRTNN